MTSIANRAAVVTGGGSGIGRALALELARRGASVAIADMQLDKALMVADEIARAGGGSIALECDVCDRASISQMAARAKAELGLISLVLPIAGATSFDPLVEMSDDDVDWIIQVNLMGVTNTVRAFLKDIIEARQGGHICATASMAGLVPGWIPVHSPYSAAKMGVIGLLMNLSLELKQHDIHTTTYCPGGVATVMKARNETYRPARFGGPSERGVFVGEESFKGKSIDFYRPEAIAPIVMRAIENNRAFVFDHSDQREAFRRTYSDVVEACYDDIEAWERENGLPEVNPDGVDLRS